jgi:hypothetical protein
MKKILLITTLFIILWSLFAAFSAWAGYKIEVSIPVPGGPTSGEPVTLTQYIRYLYLFGLSAVGIAALGALVIGGFMYMLSDTVTSKDKAKEYIWGALSGLVLGLAAYLILNAINPELIRLKPSTLPPLEEETNNKGAGGIGDGGIIYQWTQIPMNQYCADVLGENWVTVDGKHCPGPAPGLNYDCCGYFPSK